MALLNNSFVTINGGLTSTKGMPLQGTTAFSQLIGFGDSNTDTGYFFTHPISNNSTMEALYQQAVAAGGGQPTDPGSAMNTTTLASDFGLSATPYGEPGGTNYAASGATVATNSLPGSLAPTIVTQVSTYLAAYPAADPNALYYLSSGGNSAKEAAILYSSTSDQQNYMSSQADAMASAIEQLYAAGARYLVIDDRNSTTALGTVYNGRLWSDLASAGVPFLVADDTALVRTVESNPSAYGLTNVTQPPNGATSGGSTVNPSPSTISNSWSLFATSETSPNAQNTYLWADDEHLSAAGQAIEAAYTFNAITHAVPSVGETLTATPTVVQEGTISASELTYQWQRELSGSSTWVSINNATSKTYSVGSGDVGYDLRVESFFSGNADTSSAISPATAAVIAAPTITGTVANQQTTSEAPVDPFSSAVINDPNAGATDTLTITVGGSGGTLSGSGLTGGANGVYTLAGTAANVTSMLEGLSFTPNASGGSTATPNTATSAFALSDTSSAYSTATTDTNTSVVDTDPAKAPVVAITTPAAGSTVSIIDPTISGTVDVADAGSTVTLTIGSTVLGNTTVGGNGAWSIRPTFATDGTYTVTASDTNAGGTGNASDTFTINSTPNENLFGAVTHDVTSTGGDITALYQTILGRAPDAVGLEGWVSAEQSGVPLTTIAQDFLQSGEYSADYGASVQTNSAFVDQLYVDGLHRHAEPGGLQGWDNALANGTSRAQVAVDIATSPESRNDLAPTFQAGVFVPSTTDSSIARLYYGLLDRAPDAPGLQGWESAVAGGTTLNQVAQGFLSSPEYAADHGTLGNSDFVNALYEGALGRAASDPGAQGWVNQLNAGVSRPTVTLGIAESPEATTHLAPAIESGFHIA